MSLIELVSINQYTLAIYYMQSSFLRTNTASLMTMQLSTNPNDISDTSEVAEREGREAINTISN